VERKDLGETYPVAPCPECDTEAYYHLVRAEGRPRISVPLVGTLPTPTRKKEFFQLVCPHCRNSISLSNTDVEEAKVMLEYTQMYVGGSMSDEEYGKRLTEFNRTLEESLGGGVTSLFG